jgi:hypothetical protein
LAIQFLYFRFLFAVASIQQIWSLGQSKLSLGIIGSLTCSVHPASRRSLRDVLRSYKAGRCVLLTTHGMEEAQVGAFAGLLEGCVQVVHIGANSLHRHLIHCIGPQPLFCSNRMLCMSKCFPCRCCVKEGIFCIDELSCQQCNRTFADS